MLGQSVMAHCIWLGDEEIYTLRERGVGVSHCPNSNLSVRSGLCDVRRLISHGLKVGLGTGKLPEISELCDSWNTVPGECKKTILPHM